MKFFGGQNIIETYGTVAESRGGGGGGVGGLNPPLPALR